MAALITYDFGDGEVITNTTTSTIQHVYDKHGDYQVKVTAHNNVSSVSFVAIFFVTDAK